MHPSLLHNPLGSLCYSTFGVCVCVIHIYVPMGSRFLLTHRDQERTLGVLYCSSPYSLET